MKTRLLALVVALLSICAVNAQEKYALIDSEYILSKMPQYKAATENLQKQAEKFQKEISGIQEKAAAMYKEYLKERPKLSEQLRTSREEAIVALEEKVQELQQKYFGPKGEMATLQEKEVKPIQDGIYEAVKHISLRRGYVLVLDRATTQGVIFATPEIDISNDVLKVLGISVSR
ncbi:OmpH family outer membrane protein [Porphyromonas canoris]|uniref:Periplasmic chaperone for outer membrane proteins Skp n=1 Tax=Porphyromonas canoris TaxID=36875 RepID=A0ABR4XJV5_9PORP|nr:OmpH family outer membrane protein [Porphyromonas canoris]KGN91672.1 hypothetical protein HQ43_06110 [Porphyromonas canoris]